MRRWLLTYLPALVYAFLLVLAFGCAPLPGIVGAVDNVLSVLCETRAALQPARRALESGDVVAAIDIMKAYLVEHGHDDEVAAALQLLEAQVHKVLAPPPGYGNKVL